MCSRIWIKKINRRFSFKGSFTIEASVIVPITIILIAALILISFFIHDKVTLENEAVSLILEHAGNSADGQSLAEMVDEQLSAYLILTKNISATCSDADDEYSIECYASFDPRPGIIKQYTASSLDGSSVRVNITYLDGRKVLLKEKILSDTARLVTGDDNNENNN